MFSKCKMILALFTMVVLLSLTVAPAQAQTSEAMAMILLLEDIDAAVSWLYEQGYSIANIQLDRMRIDERFRFNRTLYAGNEYVIVGIGEYTVTNLDLFLYSNSGELVGEDPSTDVMALVPFRPVISREYSIVTDIVSVITGTHPDSELFFATIVAFKSV